MSESKFFPDQIRSKEDSWKRHRSSCECNGLFSTIGERLPPKKWGTADEKIRYWASQALAVALYCDQQRVWLPLRTFVEYGLTGDFGYSSCRASGVDDSAKQFCSSVRKRTRVPTLINIAQSSTRQKATLPPDPSNKASGEDAR